MRKIIFTICVMICINLITAFTVASRANSNQITVNRVSYDVIIDGESIALDNLLLKYNNRVYVSIRELSELFGYTVLWNGERGEITLESDEYRNKMKDTSFAGVLANGIGYNFIEDEFDFEKFCERNGYSLFRELDTLVLAQTPAEAAEGGQYHLHPPLQSMKEGFEERFAINVRYCSVTDNWILELVLLDAEPFSVLGLPMVLAINRSDGAMALYRSDSGKWMHEIVW